MTYWFTLIALLTLLALTLFQLALICGAPLGKFAWGGNTTVLPTRLRIASATSIVIYAVFALFIASKAGLVQTIHHPQILNVSLWVFTGYFFLGIIMNAISRSKAERSLMTPVAAILAVSFLIVTLS
jgi:hypothetical protein